MRFSNGILVVALSLGTLTLPSLAGVRTRTAVKSECVADKAHATGNCAAKLPGDLAGKTKNLKPLPVTTRAAHPRR
jgi:hypothetical protein